MAIFSYAKCCKCVFQRYLLHMLKGQIYAKGKQTSYNYRILELSLLCCYSEVECSTLTHDVIYSNTWCISIPLSTRTRINSLHISK